MSHTIKTTSKLEFKLWSFLEAGSKEEKMNKQFWNVCICCAYILKALENDTKQAEISMGSILEKTSTE